MCLMLPAVASMPASANSASTIDTSPAMLAETLGTPVAGAEAAAGAPQSEFRSHF